MPCVFIKKPIVETFARRLVCASCTFNTVDSNESAPKRYDLSDPEQARTSLSRQAEHLAGRECARTALRALNIHGIPAGNKGTAPDWPADSVGSISHTNNAAVALVGDRRYWRAIGMDTEQWMSPDRAKMLGAKLLTREEKKALKNHSPDQLAFWTTLLFSAKESLFKALNPLTGAEFHFQDIQYSGTNTLTLLKPLSEEWRYGTITYFSWSRLPSRVVTWVAVPDSPSIVSPYQMGSRRFSSNPRMTNEYRLADSKNSE